MSGEDTGSSSSDTETHKRRRCITPSSVSSTEAEDAGVDRQELIWNEKHLNQLIEFAPRDKDHLEFLDKVFDRLKLQFTLQMYPTELTLETYKTTYIENFLNILAEHFRINELNPHYPNIEMMDECLIQFGKYNSRVDYAISLSASSPYAFVVEVKGEGPRHAFAQTGIYLKTLKLRYPELKVGDFANSQTSIQQKSRFGLGVVRIS